jgi:putative ABC transport system permease protein
LRLALHFLGRSRLRSALTAVAVGAGVATIVAADLFSRSVTEEIAQTAEAQAITGFMSEQMNVGLTVVGLAVMAGACLLAVNAFAMAISQRREDIARLRAAGMTPQQTTVMILAEAGLIGLAGSALGALAGIGLSRLLADLVRLTSEMFNRFGTPPVSPGRLLWAGALGVAVALASAWFPARAAARLSPLAGLRRSQPGGIGRVAPWPAVAGALAAAALWTYLAIDPPGRWILPPWSDRLSLAFGAVWLASLALALPWAIDLAARALRRPLTSLLGVSGRLACDNLRRDRSRAVFTGVTLGMAVAMIVAVTGYMAYWFDELFFRTSEVALAENPGVGFFPLDINAGLEAYAGLTDFTIPAGLREEVARLVGDRAVVVETYFVLAPELSFMGDRYFSYVLDPRSLRDSGRLLFSFAYGDWDRALEIADQGCAVFITPSVARRNGVWLEDALIVTTPAGPLRCTVAGVGPTFVGASILSQAGIAAFGLQAPVALIVFPLTPADREALQPALEALAQRHSGAWLTDLAVLTNMQREGMKSVGVAMDGLLALAVISAALGVVNTMVIATGDRRREMGILRAAGADRAQVRRILTVEGLLLGIVGAILGTVAGVGLVLVVVVTNGGAPFGYPDFPAWEAATASARPALERGLLAVAAAPLLTAAAAWLPARRAVRGSVAENLTQGQREW